MIFITLGSQKFQFNRLLIKIDELIREGIIHEQVFAQIGYSDYMPKSFEYEKFLNRQEFQEKIRECDLVITHGGTGAIIGSIKQGKKLIAVPRLLEYGEHVDNHQMQIVTQFSNMNLLIPCFDINKLEELIKISKDIELKSYVSNTDTIIESIKCFIEKGN